MPAQKSYRSLYQKLSSYYFFYFSVLGSIIPFLGLYLQSLSFNAVEIGQLFAVLLGTKIISPNLIGWIADKQGAPIRWVRLMGLLSLVSSVGLFFFENYWSLLTVLFFFSFFWHAALPQYESYTFSVLGQSHKHQYGQIRLWGSIGFILAVLALGWLVDVVSVSIFPWVVVSLLFMVWLSSFWVKEIKSKEAAPLTDSFVRVLKQPTVWALLFISFLMQLSHGTYYGFYTLFLTAAGYSQSWISFLWALGVVAEIAIFFWMAPLMKSYSAKWLIILSLWLTLLRWLITPLFPDSITIMLFAQLLHAASFGLFHAAAIHLIDGHFQGNNQGKGQAVFAAISHGLGGALGMLSAGYAWTWWGATGAFYVSASVVVMALFFTKALKRSFKT